MELSTLNPNDWPYSREEWGELMAIRERESRVACNGCTACCKHDRVYLDPRKDDLATLKWHTEFVGGLPGAADPIPVAVLDRKDDGSCVYLTDTGCSIHGSAPSICKRMDCRVLLLLTQPSIREHRERINPQMIHVYKAGRERLQVSKD
jgi:hypothetical protein